MKRLLLPLALLFTIPFNTSCIREITFDVVVTGEHCSWDEPTARATMSRDYIIKIKPDEGYELFLAMDTPGSGIYIETQNGGPISQFIDEENYNVETSALTIPARYVSSKITINAVAEEKEEV